MAANQFNLTNAQLELFIRVHANHLAAFWEGSTEKGKRTIEHITNVVWDQEENCLKVFFDDGEWWHYDHRGNWY